jgi:hypothetical protein
MKSNNLKRCNFYDIPEEMPGTQTGLRYLKISKSVASKILLELIFKQ